MCGSETNFPFGQLDPVWIITGTLEAMSYVFEQVLITQASVQFMGCMFSGG